MNWPRPDLVIRDCHRVDLYLHPAVANVPDAQYDPAMLAGAAQVVDHIDNLVSFHTCGALGLRRRLDVWHNSLGVIRRLTFAIWNKDDTVSLYKMYRDEFEMGYQAYRGDEPIAPWRFTEWNQHRGFLPELMRQVREDRGLI